MTMIRFVALLVIFGAASGQDVPEERSAIDALAEDTECTADELVALQLSSASAINTSQVMQDEQEEAQDEGDDNDVDGSSSSSRISMTNAEYEKHLTRSVLLSLHLNKTSSRVAPVVMAAGLMKALTAIYASQKALSLFSGRDSHKKAWDLATNEPKFQPWKDSKQGSDSDWYSRYLPKESSEQPLVPAYTIGAAAPFRPAPPNPRSQDGCFPGLRIAAEKFYGGGISTLTGFSRRDPVPAIAQLLGYEHPPMNVFMLNVGRRDVKRSKLHTCSRGDGRTKMPLWSSPSGTPLHSTTNYLAGAEALKKMVSQPCKGGFFKPSGCVTGCYQGLRKYYCYTAAQNRRRFWASRKGSETCHKCSYPVSSSAAGLIDTMVKIIDDISYDKANDKEKYPFPLQAGGYTEIGRAFASEDADVFDPQSSFLLKNSQEECVVTFAGTDSWGDSFQDVQFYPTAFCGFLDEGDEGRLKTGHAFAYWGFKYHLLRMVKCKEWQNNIRARFQQCRSVTAVGHSLGGALANMFTACIHKAPRKGEAGYADYELMGFTLKK